MGYFLELLGREIPKQEIPNSKPVGTSTSDFFFTQRPQRIRRDRKGYPLVTSSPCHPVLFSRRSRRFSQKKPKAFWNLVLVISFFTQSRKVFRRDRKACHTERSTADEESLWNLVPGILYFLPKAKSQKLKAPSS